MVKLKLNTPQVIIRDALGHELLREPVQVIDEKVQQELTLTHLPVGMYICTIEQEGEIVWQSKIVKQ